MAQQIGEATSAWADLGPTQRSHSFAPPAQPSARTIEIMGGLGLRYPPASSVDRESHAARVALLAEDCADIPAEWLDYAARDWAKREPFMPRACEIREKALAHGRRVTQLKALPAPRVVQEPKPIPPPLTDEEIADLSPEVRAIGIGIGALIQRDGKWVSA